MTLDYQFILPWIVHADSLAAGPPGVFVLFFLGLAFTPFLFFSIQPLIEFFRKKGKGFTPHEQSRIGAVFSVLFLIAGIVLTFLPLSNVFFTVLAHCLQGMAFVGFELFLFLTLYFMVREEEISWLVIIPLGVVGILAVFSPVFLNVPSSWFLGGFSLILFAVMAILVFPAKKPASPVCFAAGGEILLIALSFVVPLPELQVFLWTVPLVFFLIRGERLFIRLKNKGPEDVKDAMPENAAEILPAGAIPDVEHEVLEVPAVVRASSPEEIEVLESVEEQAVPEGDVPVGVPREHIEEGLGGKKEEVIMNPFVPKEFLDIIGKEKVGDLRLSDHAEREMTIFFSDIRDFTSLLEKLTPEQSFKFINSYLTRIVPVIEAYGGFVDKYIGDAIMALFPQKDGPDKAVQSAIEIQKKLVEYNDQRKKYNYRPISMGIGIHTGKVMLGVVGVYTRMQNTVFSDSVNLASRVETLTKAFNISVAISEQTFQKLEDSGSYKYRFLGKVRVKGKRDATSVFEIMDETSKDVLEKKMRTDRFFQDGLMSFMQKKYDDALSNFDRVLEILPEDAASILYKETCRERLVIAALADGRDNSPL
jgi:two-component system sensor histidine kinase ChiS